jgi:type II secretory pathway pseudopilin PulG
MTTSTHTIRRLTAMLGLVGVALAIAAPVALADHQDVGTKAALQQIQAMHDAQWSGAVGVRRSRAPEETPDLIERYLRNNSVAVDTSDAVSRYLRNTRMPDRTATTEAIRPAIHVSVASPRTFDWRDAGIGAGSALALMLIAIGSLLIILRRKPSGTRMLSS